MALTPPDIEDLALFRNEGAFTDPETEWVESVLQQATDALWGFTSLEDDPTEERLARVLKNALMELTLWLLAQSENREEINSPFSGERIGSYSYQKLQAAQNGEDTGLFWLNLLFKVMRAPTDGELWSSSENVFTEPYESLDGLAGGMHDPTVPWTWV